MKKQTEKDVTSRFLWAVTISSIFILFCVPGWALEKQQKDIIRLGNNVTISRQFADEVKKSNDIVLSTVAVKARVDKAGALTGYQLVQIDKGSPVERMGLKAGDVITKINGIPAKEFEAKRPILEAASKFDVTIVRKSKQLKMKFDIR
jgi:membrane-associated protease RseP (regulator of RpoE activity)